MKAMFTASNMSILVKSMPVVKHASEIAQKYYSNSY